jgi:hypothetical protein
MWFDMPRRVKGIFWSQENEQRLTVGLSMISVLDLRSQKVCDAVD